jgi:hypothetical protein
MTDPFIEGPHAVRSTLAGSPFPPNADYGFLSDAVMHLIREDERRSANAPRPE